MTKHLISAARILTATAFATALGWQLPAMGQDFAGTYEIQGWEPDSAPAAPPDYRGTAEIARNGATFRFSGVIDGQHYLGKGIEHTKSGMLALMFSSTDSNERGVTLLAPTNKGFEATWTDVDLTATDQNGVGREVWTRTPSH